MKKIKLTKGKCAIVDDADYEELSKYKWHANVSRRTSYASRVIKRNGKETKIQMHREILGLGNPRIFVDHKDGNGLNNQRDNLRTCTPKENTLNRRSREGRASKYKGVWWDKRKKKWAVTIGINNRSNWLGVFDNEDEAAIVYDNAALKHYGAFAFVNFESSKTNFYARENAVELLKAAEMFQKALRDNSAAWIKACFSDEEINLIHKLEAAIEKSCPPKQ